MLPIILVLIQRKDILLHSPATNRLHMSANALLDAPSDLAVTIPGEAELIKELTKLLIFHKIQVPVTERKLLNKYNTYIKELYQKRL